MEDNKNYDRIPFPDKLVNWGVLVKGLGELALDVLVHRHKDDEHYITDAVDAEPYAQFDLWHDMGGEDAST